MSGIKRWCVSRGVTVAESSAGPFVLHEDHLASHAFDEAVERALFEAAFYVVDLAGSRDSWSGRWKYDYGHVDDLWFGWLACAKARAKYGDSQ